MGVIGLIGHQIIGILAALLLMIRANASNCLLAIAFALSTSAMGVEATSKNALQKRWLFVWRNMNDSKEVERMIARFPQAAAFGYNGVVFSHNIPAEKAPELTNAAKQSHLDL